MVGDLAEAVVIINRDEQEVSSAVEEQAASVQEIARSASESAESADAFRSVSESFGPVVSDLQTAMASFR